MSIDLEAAWELAHDPKKLDTLYAASDDPDIAEICDRITTSEGESVRVLLEEGGGLGGPYAVSRLFTDRRRWETAGLTAGVDFGRPLQPYLEKVELDWRLPILASSPYESDRTWAIDHYDEDPDTRAGFAVRLVDAGDVRGERRLLEALEAHAAFVEGSVDRIFERAPRAEAQDPSRMLLTLIDHPIEGAAPILVRLLRTDHAPLALLALARHDDPSVADDVAAYRDGMVGDPDVTALLREGAANVLRRAGRTIPLDDARFLRNQSPRRYGYPKWEDLAVSHRIAAEAFLMAGNDEEKAWVASFANSAFAMMRKVARRVEERPLRYWDRPRVNRYLAAHDLDTIFEALDSPTTVFIDQIVERMREVADEDASVRRRLVESCRRAFERVDNIYVPDSEVMPPDLNYAMYFLGGLEDDDAKALLEGTTSAWIRTFVIEGGDMQEPEAPFEPPAGVAIDAFDSAPWSIGKNINGLAFSPDGTRVAIVGSNHCRQIDASTGLTALHQELRWSWGYDVAYSPDGTKLAACFHGGHVEIYEASTGKRIADLEGHGGVPNGAKCLAWSADGATLVSGGSDSKLIAWDVEPGTAKWAHEGNGTYQDVVFLPDGRVLATQVASSKGEKNALQIFGAEKGELQIEVPRKKSIWSIAIREDGLIALGGDDKTIILSKDPLKKKFKTWRKLDQAKVTQLCFVGNTLYATSEEGFLMSWDTETLEDTSYIGEGAALWALAAHSDDSGRNVLAAGKAGVVHVLENGVLRQDSGASHGRRVVAIDVVESGIITADWDGTIIQWPREGGVGRLVAALDLTIESSAKVDDDRILYGTRKGLYLVRVSDGTVLASTDVRADEIAIDGDVIGAYARNDLAFYALPSLEPKGDPINVGTDTVNAVAAAPGGGFVTGNEDGQTCFVKGGERVWEKKHHGADRLEHGDPHCNIASIAFAPDGSRFATAATDHVVRVYSWPDAELQLRIACGFGLFNRIDFSPDGSLLAIPASWRLEVYDMQGNVICALPAVECFDGNELAGARFIGERELLVGCDTGRIFRVRL